MLINQHIIFNWEADGTIMGPEEGERCSNIALTAAYFSEAMDYVC